MSLSSFTCSTKEVVMRKQVLVRRKRHRTGRGVAEMLPLDPRDLDVVRAKAALTAHQAER